jgi:hypothetical protein
LTAALLLDDPTTPPPLVEMFETPETPEFPEKPEAPETPVDPEMPETPEIPEVVGRLVIPDDPHDAAGAPAPALALMLEQRASLRNDLIMAAVIMNAPDGTVTPSAGCEIARLRLSPL